MVTTPDHLLGQLGLRDVVVADELLILEMDNRPDLANVRGALQGGLVATLIDIAGGRLAGRQVSADQDVTTADMTVHFLAPVVAGPARAEATIVRAGRRMIVTAVDVSDVGRDRLAARATLSFAVLDRR
ncbi:PaaI family thioesterase [Mycobacterium sp. NPDC050551]|uniref:PaaI family thioesterase n=1 Tax=Mycobacterium sp. NPDC050551 TaxID=3155407 RepID=UPI003438ED83